MSIKVPITNIRPNPYQPETRLEIPEDIAEKFGKSILEHGLIQTPVARHIKQPLNHNPYEQIYEMGDGWLRLSGFRWLVAHGHLEYQEITLDVRELSDRQMADLVLEANSIRHDLNPIERAQLFLQYLEDFGITQAELARAHNVSQGEIGNTIRLLELPAEIQSKIISQEITETHGRQLLRLNIMPDLQKTVAEEAVKQRYTVNQVNQVINREIYYKTKQLDHNYCNFELKGCEGCPKRIMAADPWGNSKKEARCTDENCWNKKQAEAEEKRAAEINAKAGQGEAESKKRVLTSKDLKWGEYETFHGNTASELDNPEECKGCDKYQLFQYNRDSFMKPDRVCLKPSCFRAKKSKKTQPLHTT